TSRRGRRRRGLRVRGAWGPPWRIDRESERTTGQTASGRRAHARQSALNAAKRPVGRRHWKERGRLLESADPRHEPSRSPMRKPSHADAELLIRLYEMRRDPELRRGRMWFLTTFKPAGWSEIKSRYLSHDDEDRWFRMVTSYWELVGTLVNRGVLHDELFFDHTGEDVVTWERCKGWIADARADIRATYLYQFERLVRA